MNQPIYPAATSDNMPLLAQLLAERSVELRVASDGTLQFRDRAKNLSPADRLMLRHYAPALVKWLAEPVTARTKTRQNRHH